MRALTPADPLPPHTDLRRWLVTANGLAPFIVWAPSASLALAVGRNYLGIPLDGASVEPFHRP